MTNVSATVPKLSWAEIRARRLDRHALSAPDRGAAPADIVEAICGVHAQVMSAAELSIGIRLPGVTRTELREALWAERSLVKTRGPRGTVHLLAARDLPMWTGALSALPQPRSPFPKDVRMTPEQTDHVVDAIEASLRDVDLTVDELTEAIVDRTGSWAGDPVMEAFQGKWPRWRQAESTATIRGAMCFGPERARKVTYTNPRRWLPGFQPADGQAATAQLARRYLHAYGPATPAHFARWLAVPERWATELFDSLGESIERVDVDGSAGWVVAGDTAAPSGPPRGVRLLPYFDAYVVGCHPRELVFPGPAADRALNRGQSGNFPVLLVDGTVAGVWHQRRSGRWIDVTVEPLRTLTAAQARDLDDQVERIGEILQGRPRLTIGTVTVGPHA
jgi:hypothetical protein